MEKKKSKDSIGSAIVVGFLLFLAFLAILYTYYYTKTAATDISTVTLDKVDMAVQSADNENHSVELEVSIEGLAQTLNSNSKKEFELIVADVLNKADYEKISGKDGTEYIKGMIKEELQKKYGKDKVNEVYISSMLCDTKLPSDNSKENQRDEVMKGMFRNMEKNTEE